MTPTDLQQIEALLDKKLAPISAELILHRQLLQDHSRILKEHTTILHEHTTLLKEHTIILTQHTTILNEHTTKLNQHDTLLNQHSMTLKKHGKLLKSLKKDQDTMLDMLDKELMQQAKRLKRLEAHIAIPS